MAGGLMQLVSEGQQNIILNGNPSKTFFKAAYARYTNFGMQKFRVDFEGAKTLRLAEESQFTFKIPRYADLLMDCYLSVDMPNIWSPIMPPNTDQNSELNNSGQWVPYEFKWIESLGALMISRITITCGNQTIQEYSGEYIKNMTERDFNGTKVLLFNEMTGNIPEMNDPANSGARVNAYPNSYYNPTGAGPSINGRTLYIPLNSWFNFKTQMAFPLISLQYNELHVNITMRPIQELFRIRDVFDSANNYPYISPNFNLWYMQFYRFLQTPPDVELGLNSYVDTRTLWNADIHLNCTYCFLSNEEARLFALQEQSYLFKQVREQKFYNVTGANKVQLDSNGMVAGMMFYFQRSDANLRNEWSNYSNWPYNYAPYDITPAPTGGDYTFPIVRTNPNGSQTSVNIGPGVNPNGQSTPWYITGGAHAANIKGILTNMAILLDGSYRENAQPVGVYNYIEKWLKTVGAAPPGLYCYNYCLGNNPLDLKPMGAINMSRFTTIELEFNTIVPTLDPYAQSLAICDPQTGNIIGINKPTWRIYDYNFDLTILEERWNVVTFVGGNCGLMYAT